MKNYDCITLWISTASEQEYWVALLAEFSLEGIEEHENSLRVFGEAGVLETDEIVALAKNEGVAVTTSQIAEQNWNAEWEASFDPIVVDDFVAIRACFHPANHSVKHELVITPKMSFGTGHHPTTRLMIRAMGTLNFFEKVVLDFGTGTGVLAILAEKLGAQKVDAFDIDLWSINNAQENAQANHTHRIDIFQAASLSKVAAYDVVLANINLHIILENLVSMVQALKSGAYLILSGLLVEDELVITEAIEGKGLTIQRIFSENGWLSLVAFSNLPQH